MMERKKYYMDMVVGDYVYVDEEEGVSVQRYFFGLRKRLVPKQSLYRITEVFGIDNFGRARKELASKSTFMKIGLVNVETKRVRHIVPTGYSKIAKKRKVI